MAAQQTGSASLEFGADTYEVTPDQERKAYISVIRTGNTTAEASVDCLIKERQTIKKTERLTFTDQESSKTFVVDVPEDAPSDGLNLALANPQNASLGKRQKALLRLESPQGVSVRFPILGLLKYVACAVVLTVAIYGLHQTILETVDEWGREEFYKDLKLSELPPLVFPSNTRITTEHQQRLKDQLEQIRQLIKMHFAIMEFYYKRYVAAISTSSAVAAIAAIMLFLITKNGWDTANPYVITTFFITTAAAVFIGSWPSVYQHDKNITGNKVLYLKYRTLENELLSYAATNEALNYAVTSEDLKKPANPGEVKKDAPPPKGASPGTTPPPVSKIGMPLSAQDFIHYVDLQLSQDNIAIGFDYSMLPDYKDVFKTK